MNNTSSSVRWKPAKLSCKRLLRSTASKAIECNVPIIVVDPRGISSTYPRCRSGLEYIARLAICIKCGLKMDIDFVGAINTWIRALKAYAGALWSSPKRFPMNSEVRGRRERKTVRRRRNQSKIFTSEHKCSPDPNQGTENIMSNDVKSYEA